MTKHLCGSLCECLKMSLHIRKQECEIAAVMIVCHDPSRDAPEPFDAVGIGIIGGRIDQIQVLLQRRSRMLRKSRDPADVCVLRLSVITRAMRSRRLERATAARTWSQNTSAVRPGATRPPSQPSRQSTRPKP